MARSDGAGGTSWGQEMLGHQGEDGSARDRKLLKCCWFHFVSTGVSFSLKMACSVFKCDLVLFFFLSKKKKNKKNLMGEQSSGSLIGCCGGGRCPRNVLRSSAVEALFRVPWSRRVRTVGMALQLPAGFIFMLPISYIKQMVPRRARKQW